MWDHLDDVDPPVPGDGERTRIGRRARQRKQRRTAAAGASAGALVLAAVVLGVTTTGGPGEQEDSLLVPTPTATASPEPEPTATPTPRVTRPPATSVPTPTRGAASTPLPRTTVSAGPSTCATDCPDGQPGWVSGGERCVVWNRPLGPASREVAPGLTASFALQRRATVQSFTGTLTFTNTGEVALDVSWAAYNRGLLLVTGGELDEEFGDVTTLRLAPGAARSKDLLGSTRTCSDTPVPGRLSLAAATYPAGPLLRLTVDAVLPEEPTPTATPSGSPSPTASPVPTRLVDAEQVSLGAPIAIDVG